MTSTEQLKSKSHKQHDGRALLRVTTDSHTVTKLTETDKDTLATCNMTNTDGQRTTTEHIKGFSCQPHDDRRFTHVFVMPLLPSNDTFILQ